MAPGKVAVVADADETWVTPVETRLGALGATTFRRLPDEVIDDGLVRESQAAQAELDQLETELRTSTGEARAKVRGRDRGAADEARDDRDPDRHRARDPEVGVRGTSRDPAGAAREGAGAAEGSDRCPHRRAEGLPRRTPGEASSRRATWPGSRPR